MVFNSEISQEICPDCQHNYVLKKKVCPQCLHFEKFYECSVCQSDNGNKLNYCTDCGKKLLTIKALKFRFPLGVILFILGSILNILLMSGNYLDLNYLKQMWPSINFLVPFIILNFFALFRLYVAFKLWKKQSNGASLAKIYLVSNMLAEINVFFFLLAFGDDMQRASSFFGVIYTVIGFIIWFSYFNLNNIKYFFILPTSNIKPPP